jgi:hypothetical protein
MTGWFLIDVVAIIPFDLMISADYNGLVRVARIGKLYKLIKITRLLRILKVIKQQKSMMRKVKDMFKLGKLFENTVFGLMFFSILSHCIACLWIFIADMSLDESLPGDIVVAEGEYDSRIHTNWINKSGYDNLPLSELYLVSLYYTFTTMSTVGYGDIAAVNKVEHALCIFLMLVGVFFFSYMSGSVSNMIQQREDENRKD